MFGSFRLTPPPPRWAMAGIIRAKGKNMETETKKHGPSEYWTDGEELWCGDHMVDATDGMMQDQIVRALNGHDAMLATLKDARIALSFYRLWMAKAVKDTPTDYPFGILAEEQARAAIAQAS